MKNREHCFPSAEFICFASTKNFSFVLDSRLNFSSTRILFSAFALLAPSIQILTFAIEVRANDKVYRLEGRFCIAANGYYGVVVIYRAGSYGSRRFSRGPCFRKKEEKKSETNKFSRRINK